MCQWKNGETDKHNSITNRTAAYILAITQPRRIKLMGPCVYRRATESMMTVAAQIWPYVRVFAAPDSSTRRCNCYADRPLGRSGYRGKGAHRPACVSSWESVADSHSYGCWLLLVLLLLLLLLLLYYCSYYCYYYYYCCCRCFVIIIVIMNWYLRNICVQVPANAPSPLTCNTAVAAAASLRRAEDIH